MKVITTTLQQPIARRTELRIEIEKRGRKIKTNVELGTITPHGTRWTQYNKLRKQLTHHERTAVESQIIRASREPAVKTNTYSPE